jgi:hypothetical protein
MPIFSRTPPLQHSFACFGDDGSHVQPKGIADTKQGIERWIPRSCFQAAHQRLAQTGLFGEKIPGNPLPLSLLNEELYDLGTHFVMQVVFYHAWFLSNQGLGNAYHYTDMTSRIFCGAGFSRQMIRNSARERV